MPSTSPQKAISDLLISLFDRKSLERFLSYNYSDVVHEVGGDSLADYTHSAVSVLARQGCLGPEFFRELVTEFPLRADEINATAQRVAEFSEAPDIKEVAGRRWPRILLLALVVSVAGLVAYRLFGMNAQTSISGRVTDAITGAAVARAHITVDTATGERLNESWSDERGTFQLRVDVSPRRAPVQLSMKITHNQFIALRRTIEVGGDAAKPLTYSLQLTRAEANACPPDRVRPRSVVVGRIRRPIKLENDIDLSERLRTIIEFNLKTAAQKDRLRPLFAVLACPEAESRTIDEHPAWPEALEVDAFMTGWSEMSDGLVVVKLLMSARYDQAKRRPRPISTRALDVDKLESAQLGAPALGPILLALARAYQANETPSDCVSFTGAAQRLLEGPPRTIAAIQAIRRKCQRRLPHQALLGRTDP